MANFRNLTSPGTVYSFSPGVPAALPGWTDNGSPDGVVINDAKSLHGLSGWNAIAAERHTVVADVKLTAAALQSGSCHFVLGDRHRGKPRLVSGDNSCGAIIGGNIGNRQNLTCLEGVEGWVLSNGDWVNTWPMGDPFTPYAQLPQVLQANRFFRFVLETVYYRTYPTGNGNSAQVSRIKMRVFNSAGQKLVDSAEGDVFPRLFDSTKFPGNEHVIFAKIFQGAGQTMWAKNFKSAWTGENVRISDAEILALGTI